MEGADAVPLYLGLDSSTQSLTAVVIEIESGRRQVVFESTLNFDEALPQYRTRHGVLPNDDPAVALSSPVMWADALDVMMTRVAGSGLDISRLAAIAGSAQQHGSVYLSDPASTVLPQLDPERGLAAQIPAMLSRPVAPIWMDSSTTTECAEIAEGVGGNVTLAARTGSRAFERFTGPQIRKFFKQNPGAYSETERIHLVSSFLASLLVGQHAPIDTGDGSGMNLMDLAAFAWWPEAVDATAPNLQTKLPPLTAGWAVLGRLSRYWQQRHGLPPAKVVAWSGDNPCSLIGTGLVREGLVAVSLGTSDTIFGLMREPRVDPSGTGHVFGAPTGDYMGITVFKNGSLARERVRDQYGLSWSGFSAALAATPPGNEGRIMLPWFEPEITPDVGQPGVRRYGLNPDDGPANVRGIVEAQAMAIAFHSRWMKVGVKRIYATGGAAKNRETLQILADVFGADVYQFHVGNSACLGAALRAFHADATSDDRYVTWDEVVRELAEPVAETRLRRDRRRHAMYTELVPAYAACEEHALGRGPDPAPAIARFLASARRAADR
jgi:xylulokinase